VIILITIFIFSNTTYNPTRATMHLFYITKEKHTKIIKYNPFKVVR